MNSLPSCRRLLQGLALWACAMLCTSCCTQQPRADFTIDLKQTMRLRPGAVATCHVRAATPDNDTRVEVHAGEVYDLHCAPGQQWKDASFRVTPGGRASLLYRAYMTLYSPLKRCRSAPWFALVGRTTEDDKDSFLIGEGKKGFIVQKSGTLHCFANDVKGFYFNNHGCVELTVTRKK